MWVVFLLPGQSGYWSYSQQQERLRTQRQNQEQRRQEEVQRVDRERKLLACLKEEDNFEKRRNLRQVQKQLWETHRETVRIQVRVLCYTDDTDRFYCKELI